MMDIKFTHDIRTTYLTSCVVHNNKTLIQNGGRPPYCRILKTRQLKYK